jgi:hypothetical protein
MLQIFDDGFCAGAHVEFLIHRLQIVSHRLVTEVEFIGHFFGHLAMGQEFEDLGFTRGEARDLFLFGLGRFFLEGLNE